MKRAIITGVSGQDGTLLSRFLCSQGTKVLGLHRGNFPKQIVAGMENQENLTLVKVRDYLDKNLQHIIQDFKPDYIYALHGNSFPKSAQITKRDFIIDPVMEFLYHMEILSTLTKKVKYLLCASSEIFASESVGLLDETTQVGPRNSYGLGKLNLLSAGKYFRDFEGEHIYSAILFPHESEYRRDDFVIMKLIESFTGVHNRDAEPLIFGDLSSSRDFGSGKDYVKWMSMLVESGLPGDYCFATGVNTRIDSIIDLIAEIMGIELERRETGGKIEFASKLDPKKIYVISKPANSEFSNYTYPAGQNKKLFKEIGVQEITDMRDWIGEMIAAKTSIV